MIKFFIKVLMKKLVNYADKRALTTGKQLNKLLRECHLKAKTEIITEN